MKKGKKNKKSTDPLEIEKKGESYTFAHSKANWLRIHLECTINSLERAITLTWFEWKEERRRKRKGSCKLLTPIQ